MEINEFGRVTAREEEGQSVHVRDAEDVPQFYGEPPKPVTVRIVGTYSQRYQAAMDRVRQRAQKRRGTPLTSEQSRRQDAQVVAECILGWEGFESGGQPLPFTVENAVQVLLAAPWLYRQLDAAMEDHAAFFATSSGN